MLAEPQARRRLHRYLAELRDNAFAPRGAFTVGEVFDIDPAMPEARHAEAVRMYLGLKAYLEDNGYAGYTAHFEEFGADGRFTQLPLLAASSLMADGYGYAAEGDATAAMWMAAMIRLCGQADFSEMYMMDLAREAILFCHAGEGNWALCRRDRKPFLMDRVFNEGGLSNPPTPIFCPEPGPMAVMSLVHLGADRFRLVYFWSTVPLRRARPSPWVRWGFRSLACCYRFWPAFCCFGGPGALPRRKGGGAWRRRSALWASLPWPLAGTRLLC